MRRRMTIAALALCLTLSGIAPAGAASITPLVTTLVLTVGSPVMLIDGVRTALEVPPFISNGRTFVPIRRIAEALSASVTYDAALRQVDIVRPDVTLSLVIGKPTAMLNASAVPIDSADSRIVPLISAGRTMLPLRFVTESLGSTVMYNMASRVITIIWEH